MESIDIIICSFIPNKNIIVKASKNLRKMMQLIDCSLQRIIIIIVNLIKIVLAMILLMTKCDKGMDFDIVTIYHHNGVIFYGIGNIYIIWIVFHAIHINFTQKVNTSASNCGSYKLSTNEIILYILNKTMAIIVMIIHYHTFILNDNQLHQIINKKHNSDLILTVINVIEIIVHHCECVNNSSIIIIIACDFGQRCIDIEFF